MGVRADRAAAPKSSSSDLARREAGNTYRSPIRPFDAAPRRGWRQERKSEGRRACSPSGQPSEPHEGLKRELVAVPSQAHNAAERITHSTNTRELKSRQPRWPPPARTRSVYV